MRTDTSKSIKPNALGVGSDQPLFVFIFYQRIHNMHAGILDLPIQDQRFNVL